MDALNLAIVICPNLVKGSNQARDVAMVCVPGTPAFFDRPTSSNNDGNGKNPQGDRSATLGMIIAICIRRYYEVFDEVVDPNEAIPAWRTASRSPEQSMYVLSNEGEEEEDLDDDKLQKRVSPSTSRSIHTVISETNGSIRIGDTPTYGKAKTTINIENSGASGNESGTTAKGSITIGRGTTRKSSGAGVEAIGVTAGGFFSAPDNDDNDDDDTPLVPDGKGGWKKS